MLRPDDEWLRSSLQGRLLLRDALPLLKGAPIEAADAAEHAGALPEAMAAAGLSQPILEAWRSGDPAALAGALGQLVAPRSPPAVLHHLALLHGRFAMTTADLPRAMGHESRAFVLWLRLWAERGYLLELATRVAGRSDLAEEVIDDLPRILLESHASALARGRREPTPAARRAMGLLRSVPAQVGEAGLPPPARERVERIAREVVESIAREVVEEARLLAEQVDPLRAEAAEREAPFRHVLGFAEWAGLDEETIVFLLGQAHDYGWELYRARRMTELRSLLAPLRRSAEELLGRIAKDPRMVGYRALCAQYFTFLGETEPASQAAIAHLETAVDVCPTHRNARLVLSDLLLADAARRLHALPPRALFGPGRARRDALVEIQGLVRRATTLWPHAKVPAGLESALRELDV